MQQEFSIELELKAFFLRPDTPPEGIPRKGGGGEVQEPLATYAREAGLTMRRAPVSPSTWLAHEATEFAKEQGSQVALHKALYTAYWADGKNIGDMQVLLELAQQAGLDASAMEQALKEQRHKTQVWQQFEEAQSLGVNGVPAFVVGRYLFTGAQPYPLFQRVAKLALGEMELPHSELPQA